MRKIICTLSLALSANLPLSVMAAEPEQVNVDNFVRAETAFQIERFLNTFEAEVNEWRHLRQPTSVEQQPVIRMNLDTLYGSALVDIREGATLTMPETGGRYMTVMVINEDHYINRVYSQPGKYQLTMDEFDTPYVFVAARTLVDAADKNDIAKVNALQDQLSVSAKSAVPYSRPNYDMDSYKVTYDAVIELSRGVPDTQKTFGSKEQVDPIRHLLGTAFGWGGLPDNEAFYLNVEPDLPVGHYQLTVNDVPVNAFWSVTVYNSDGFMEANDADVYSVNSVTGEANEDGSFTINFGGDPDLPNSIPLSDGWNYLVRLYKPEPEVLTGEWVFPSELVQQ